MQYKLKDWIKLRDREYQQTGDKKSQTKRRTDNRKVKKGQRTKVKCRTNDKYWEGCLGIKDIETEKGVKGGLDDWMTQTYRTINVNGVFSVIGLLQSSS